MIEYKIPINKLRSCLQKTGENHSQNDLSTENERQKALDALERIEKTLYSFWNRPEKPEVFGLPPIDFETIRAALQSPRVPVIEGLDEAMSVINKFIRARDAEIDFLPEKSTKNTSEWISHFMHNVNYSLSFNDWMNLDKVRAYAELQKGN